MKNLIKFLIEPFLGKKLRLVTFFVTSKCNSHCNHCFYWKTLGKQQDMPLEEIRKISNSLRNFNFLSLSGGEPFLRDDLPEICKIFYQQNNVRDISIPTNSLMPKRVLGMTKKILEYCPESKISLNLSLDGLKNTHDKMRGVKGSFNKIVKTVKGLKELRHEHKNLIINISTVLSNFNLNEVKDLIGFVKQNLEVDSHSFEVLRGSPKDKNFKPLTPEQFESVLKLIIENNYHYFKKKGVFKAIYLKKKLEYFFRQQYLALKGENWDMPCLAGKTIMVIEPNGDIRPCELLEPVGNIKRVDYDFNTLWGSKKAKDARAWIKKNKCSCTQCVALNASISYNPFHFFIGPLIK